MLSNGLEAKVGTLGSKYEFFHEWKRLAVGDAGAIDMDTMLIGMCNKRTFMDLFENFILYDHSGTKTAKILARNHQYLGVNEAVAAYADRKVRSFRSTGPRRSPRRRPRSSTTPSRRPRSGSSR